MSALAALEPRLPDDRPRAFYLSYDGLAEPLGRSQVLPYLIRLASEFRITLISFERSRDDRARLETELAAHEIEWLPLRYHHSPPVVSTAVDVLAGRRALIKAARLAEPAIVHVRSDVPALIALAARGTTNAKLLFDIRGFWADERIDGGLWRPRSSVYRVAKLCELRFFRDADAIVTLTEASVPQIRSWAGARPVSIDVIPTCVDLEHFLRRPARPGGPHAIWSGSIGTWYRFDLAPKIARALALPLTVITRQATLAREQLAGRPASVLSVKPEEVPSQLFSGDVGLCLIKSSFSKIASAPTRFAEFLAAGMPVLVTPGVGDLERIVTDYQVGAVLRGEDDTRIADAAGTMRDLARDAEMPDRCRSVARELFDVDTGGARYSAIYHRLINE